MDLEKLTDEELEKYRLFLEPLHEKDHSNTDVGDLLMAVEHEQEHRSIGEKCHCCGNDPD